MNNLIDIQSQIDKLQKQASDIKIRDFDKTVAEILIKMEVFGITAKDLISKKKSRTKNKGTASDGAPSKRSTITRHVAAKYKGPNGEAWSGRGKMPRWLAGLVAQGRSKEDFAVKC